MCSSDLSKLDFWPFPSVKSIHNSIKEWLVILNSKIKTRKCPNQKKIDLRSVKMKDITFNELINLFLKIRPTETLAICTQESAYTCNFLQAYAGLILRTHSKFQKLHTASFLPSFWGLEQIPHHLGVVPNPYFHTTSSLTCYIFKKQKIPWENTRIH